MARRRVDVEVQRALTGALWNLAADPAMHPTLVTAGSGGSSVGGGVQGASLLRQTLLSMDAHPMSHAVQEQGCGFLWSVASEPRTRTLLAQGDVVDSMSRVVRAVRLHQEDPGVALAGCAALCNLAACGDGGGPGEALYDAVQAGVDQGAMGVVVGVLARHSTARPVVHMACMALWALLTPRVHLGSGGGGGGGGVASGEAALAGEGSPGWDWGPSDAPATAAAAHAVPTVHAGGKSAALASGALALVTKSRMAHKGDPDLVRTADAVVGLLLA
jgi:hypothetical protein